MILITGAPGFLGRQILSRLLAAEETSTLCLVVRRSAVAAPVERLKQLFRELFGEGAAKYLTRIQLVEGDLEQEHFGMGSAAFRQLASKITSISPS